MIRRCLFVATLAVGPVVACLAQGPKQPKVAPGPNEPDWEVILKDRRVLIRRRYSYGWAVPS